MNQYKRLLGNTFIFAIGTFSSKILVILMLRFYTGMMTQDEMGVADLIIKTTSILYPVVSLSIGQAVIRYGLERKYYKRSVFTIALVTVLCGFIIALPFHPLLNLIHYNTSAGVTGSLLEYQWIIYLYVLTSCTQNVCSQFIRALGHVRLYAIDGIFRTFVTIMLNILYLKVFRWNILGYVFSIICSDALSTVCLFIIAGLWKYVKLKRLDTHLWRGMLAYSLPLVPDAILVYIIGFSDQVFLASMQDTAVSAIYSIAYRVPTLIALVASIFVDAWQISMVNNNTKDVLLERRQHILVHRVHHRVRRRNVRQAGYDRACRAQLLYRLDVHPDSGGRRGLQLPVQLPEKRVPAGKEDGRVLSVHGVLRGY
mgnify:CR=1 FL=1